MIARRTLIAQPLRRALRPVPHLPRAFSTTVARPAELTEAEQAELLDPEQNGGYINPIPVKRSLRDPYGDWWDKQDRRNWGEPVHEDNDILGVFSTEEYTHFKPGHGALLLGSFIATVFALCGVCLVFYPDKPAAARTFGEDGLLEELGGVGAKRARKAGEDAWKEEKEE